jgi:hypothetical protein
MYSFMFAICSCSQRYCFIWFSSCSCAKQRTHSATVTRA